LKALAGRDSPPLTAEELEERLLDWILAPPLVAEAKEDKFSEVMPPLVAEMLGWSAEI
jgi:hypothetical protein